MISNIHSTILFQPSPVSQKRLLEDSSDRDLQSSGPPPSKRPLLQDNMGSHVVKTSVDIKECLDEKVAKFFYGCNIPFSVVEHPLFTDLVQSLRPGYKLPTRKALGDKHLDSVTEQLSEQMMVHLQGKTVTLVEDGWSNLHNEPVVARCLSVEGKSFYLDADETTTMPKTADNCAKLCRDAINKAEDKYKCHVRNIVTDNAKNMEKMRKNLQEKDEGLVVYGCLAHWLNLLGQDITPSSLMKHITEVQKYFRNHHRPAAWLKECEGSVKPQLPGDTRWKSQLTCLDTFLTNRTFFTKIAEDHEGDIDKCIIQKIMDYNLYRQARDLADQLRPIAEAIDRAQGDSTSLADACDIFLQLLDNPKLQPHKDAIQQRYKQAIQPCHLVTYLLHPKYQGLNLSPEQKETAHSWLLEKSPDYLCTAIAFETKSSPFPPSFFQVSHLSPVTWWRGLQSYPLPTGFIPLMVQLHSACASSASIERVFSSFGLIHSKLRNRLGVQKASKLVLCYRMLRGTQELEY